MRGGSKYHYERAIIGPPAKRHKNGVSLACWCWPKIECWVGSFVIFQGIWTRIAMKSYILVIFLGGGGGVRTPCPPSGSAHGLIMNAAIRDRFIHILPVCLNSVQWILFRHRKNSRLTLVMCGSRRGVTGGPDPPPPWKITTIYGSLAILVRIPLKLQSYQSSIQRWAIIGAKAKRHLNGISLAGRWWPTNSGIWILPPLIKLKKSCQSWTPQTKLSGSALASVSWSDMP